MNQIDDFLSGNAPSNSSGSIDDFLGVSTPKKKPKEPSLIEQITQIGSDLGLSFTEGAKNTGRAVASTGNTITGDLKDVEQYAADQQVATKQGPAAKQAFNKDLADRKAALGEQPDSGVMDTLGYIGKSAKAIGGAVVDNPEGATQFLVEQLPNSIAALAPGLAGAKAGALAGTAVAPGVGTAVGGVAGFLGGMFLGNAALEVGNKAMEKAEGGLTADEASQAIGEGATKAAVITGVDGLTLGAGGAALKALNRVAVQAGARAEAKVLADAGVNLASRQAIETALVNPALKAAATQAGKEAAKAASTIGSRAIQGGTGLTMETIGEGAGEYFGELAATGKADIYDAVIESFAGLGQSGAETAFNLSKSKGNELDSKGIQGQAGAVDVVQPEQGPAAVAANQPENLPANEVQPAQQAIEQTTIEQAAQPEALLNEGAAPQGGPTPGLGSDEIEIRLTELDLLASERDLTPEERNEAESLIAQIDTAALQNESQVQPSNQEQADIEQTQPEQVTGAITPEVAPSGVVSQSTRSPQNQPLVSADQQLPAAQPIAQPLPPGMNSDLQNRDRARIASVVQMAQIAKNPDYGRLGRSQSPDAGAPMVFAVGDDQVNIPSENMGAQDVATMADGQRVPFRYAVVDAGRVQPSNFVDGTVNPEFTAQVPGTLKALNNGRTAGLRAAYEQGTAKSYRNELLNDAGLTGIDPSVIAKTENPVLVRVYSEASNTPGMAAKSQGQGLGMSPGELARQDAPLISTDLLSEYRQGDIASADNRNFVLGFVGQMQATGQDIAGMVTQNGELSPAGRQRIQAALMQAAYSDADLVAELFDSLDTDIKAIGEALKAVAGSWANMRDSALLGLIDPDVDLTDNLIQAVNLVRRARREGKGLYDISRQVDLTVGDMVDPLTLGFLQIFYPNQYMTRAAGKDKVVAALQDYVTAALNTQPVPDMFGEVVTASQILDNLINTGTLPNVQNESINQAQEGKREPSGVRDTGDGADQAGQRAEQQGAQAEGLGSDSGSQSQPEGGEQPSGPSDQTSGSTDNQDNGVSEQDKRFPTIGNITPPSLGPMGAARITPIAQGKTLYRETNLDGLDSLAYYDRNAESVIVFVADNVDIALGQGANKGALIEFRPDSLSGEENIKPGTGDFSGREYQTNVAAPRAIAAITMKAVEVPRLRGITRKMLASEFEKTVLGNGFVQYRRKGLDVSGETGTFAEEKKKAKATKPAKSAKPKEEKPADFALTQPTAEELAAPAVSANKVFTEDAAEKARALLRRKLNQLNSGLDPEVFQAGIQLAGYHIERGARTFAAYAKAMLDDLGDVVQPYLKQWYEGVRYDPRSSDIALTMSDPMEVAKADVNQLKEVNNVQPAEQSTQRDSQQPNETQVNEGAVSDVGQRKKRGSKSSSKATGQAEDRSNRDRGVPDGIAVADGKPSDIRLFEDAGGFKTEPAGGNQPATIAVDSAVGVESKSMAIGSTEQLAGRVASLEEKLELQRKAEKIPIKFANKASIEETLPLLLDGQREDVLFAEQRWAKPNGYGVLFTNGTGTGKTLLGLGTIKRMAKQGKGNIIVVVPNEAVVNAWANDAKKIGLTITPLESISTAGKGIVITTYANFGQNDELAKRDWDMVVMDEAHSLMQSGQADETRSLSALRAVTLHPEGWLSRAKMQNRELLNRMQDSATKIEGLRKLAAGENTMDEMRAEYQAEIDALEKLASKDLEAWKKAQEAAKQFVGDNQGENRPRAMFLSATPFAYEKNVQWAEGYLFEFGKRESNAYNAPGGYEQFMITHFGYRMRYGKLTEPDAKVDRDLMQRNFNTWLRKQRALSTRMLDVEADYERKFVLIDGGIGQKIDEGMDWLRTAENGRYSFLQTIVSDRFDRLTRMRLLESIKARAAVPYIKKHHELGRKVVVFYDFNVGGGSNVFDMSDLYKNMLAAEASPLTPDDDKTVEVPVRGQGNKVNTQKERVARSQLVKEFMDTRRDLQTLNFAAYGSPLSTLLKEFPNAGVYNGMQEYKKTRIRSIKDFNDDNLPGNNLLMVQKAANAGWSGHDTTGKNQRVLINLGLPTAPIESIQQEGRIYRTGQVTDAIFQYFNTGTNWERYAFGSTISRRAGTAENLAMGEQARGLREAFIQAFENSDGEYTPNTEDGKGGKKTDRELVSAITEFDRARALYYAQQKKTSKNKAAEGKDYFATPEPIGLKMVEFADIRFGEDVLEPSAGHGAIARWFPESTNRTMIEPSPVLGSRLSLASDGKIIDDVFENLNIVNKYDAIVMNPPFGVGGKTAIEHLDKATNHLRDGGRVVALIPEGPAADKRFEKWLFAENEKGKQVNDDLVLVANISLANGVFERAGTNVKTRIVVIEKLSKPEDRARVRKSTLDFSNRESVEEIFDGFGQLSIAPRLKQEQEAVPANAPVLNSSREADVAAREAEKVAQESGVIAQSKEDVYFEPRGDKLFTNAPTVTVTTKAGKQLEGVLIPNQTLAKQIDKFTYAPLGKNKGFFVRLRHVERPQRPAMDDYRSAMFSRLQSAEPGYTTVGQIESLVKDLTKGWVNKPEVVVADSMRDEKIPMEVRIHDAQQKMKGKTGDSRGVFHQGKVYLISSGIYSKKDVAEVLFHEALGHYGLRGVFGDSLNTVLDQVALARPSVVADKAREYDLDVKKRGDRRIAAEEVLAEMAQTRPELGFVKRAVVAIRAWLRSNMPGFKDLAVSDSEIIQNYIQPARGWVEKSSLNKPISETSNALAFSRTSVTNSPEFKRWFGDSKVVDADGKPMVVYHGTTSDISIFDAGKTKAAEVIFTTPNPAGASIYAETKWDGGAPNVIPLYVSIKRPVYIKTDEYSFDALQMASSRGDVDGVLVVDDSGGIVIAAPFDSTQIKSAIGNNGQFDTANPDIRFSRTNLNGTVPPQPGPKQQNKWTQIKAKVNELLNPDRFDDLLYQVQDRFIDLRRLRDNIKELGGTISDMNDAYLGEELYHKRLAKRSEDFLKTEIKPLLADMRARNVSTDQFEKYLHARHAEEANKALADINPNQQMIDKGRKDSADALNSLKLQLQRAKSQGTATLGIEQAIEQAQSEASRWAQAQPFKGTEAERNALSGMSNQQAKALLNGLTPPQRIHMDALAAQVDAINQKTLQTLEKYGLETKQTLDVWRQKYKYYVPLYRDEAHPESASHPIGQGFSTKGSASKSRTGSSAEVTNILAHVAMQRETALTRGEKNRVAKSLYLMAAQNPDAKYWSLDAPPVLKTVDPNTGFVREGIDPTYRNKPNVVMVRIAGKDRAIVFNERNPNAIRLAGVLKNLDMGDLGQVLSLVSKGTRWFASVNTQYNPVFGLINFARDVQSGLLNLSTTPLAGKQKEVAAGMGNAMRAIYRDTRGKGKANPVNEQWIKLWDDLQNTGGTTGYRDLFSKPKERAEVLLDEIRALDAGKGKKAWDATFKWLSDYNETMENAVRLSAYKVALDQGMSKERAASLAKNLTVNFNRKGAVARDVGAWFAFFNAAVQGTTRMAQTLAGPAGKKIMYGGVALGMANALLAMAFMGGLGDDEEDNYSKIPLFVRERSLIIPLSSKDYIALPMPLGFHVIPNIGRIAAEFAFGNSKGLGSSVGSLLGIFAEAFNPIGGGSDFGQMVTPTVFDPILALYRNKDWTGQPIYREDMNGLDPSPGFSRTKETASWFAKEFSQAMNALTGGTQYMPGAWSPTPDQFDYVVGQLTGGVGREILKLSQTAAAPFNGDELPLYKVPLVGRVVGTTRGPSGELGKFYDTIKEINAIERQLKGTLKDGGDADEVLEEYPKAALIGDANSAYTQIRKLRELRRDTAKQEEDGYRAELSDIDAQMAEIMSGLNRKVKMVEKEANK